ncbi:hypothetical protein B4119_2208 [Parageobacillus caldoxylosilyticus]|uniref:Uncharacterized protein n=1 Tax=Saccharococcus caldoxylosilyticus TaxID=81408 RepID=A0A150LU56_9BACL|nr:hypothetical protein B4119_2208 [Parageobacillus caldoxylosilyticus]
MCTISSESLKMNNGGEKAMRSMYKKIFYLFFIVICLTFVVFTNLT